jgi:CheY-like chemotaxis protein
VTLQQPALKKILLAEDDPRDVKLTLTALGVHSLDGDVEVVSDGEAVLDYLFRRGAYEARPEGLPLLVLLDLKMPKLDGLEVLARIRGDRRLSAVPVVMLTSSREERDVLQSYRSGANAYVVKPVRFDEFIDAVSEVGVFWACVNEPPPGCVRGALPRRGGQGGPTA